MKVVWLTEYYEPQAPDRASEIRAAIESNLLHRDLDERHIFFHGNPDFLPEWITSKRGVHVHRILERWRFRDFLGFCEDPKSVHIMTNADIRLDNSASILRNVRAGELWALSRWNNGVSPGFLDRSTQDTWAVRGGAFSAELLRDCEFSLGLPGCDNAFAGRMKDAGFRVVNYSLSVRTDHLHDSGQRTYGSEMTVPRPYFYPHPTRAPLTLRLRNFLARSVSHPLGLGQRPPQD